MERHAKKYEELWNNIRDLIRSISNNSFRSFTSIDHLTLKKTLELFNMIIVARFVFHKDNNYQSEKCIYKLAALQTE